MGFGEMFFREFTFGEFGFEEFRFGIFGFGELNLSGYWYKYEIARILHNIQSSKINGHDTRR